MPRQSDIHIDKALTNISVKYFQDPANFIADIVFPTVPVQKQSDRYFRYHRDDWFRDDARLRAMGTESAGGDYDIDNTPSYFCQKYAFHRDIHEEERANSDNPLTPDETATEFVVGKIRLNKEVNWTKTFFRAGVWATDYRGSHSPGTGTIVHWNDYANSNPVGDISTMSTDMMEVTGQRPNTLVLGRRVYDALREHPDVLDRIKFTQRGIITLDILAAFFDIERILVCNAIQNTAAKVGKPQVAGQPPEDAHDMSFIQGNHALLCYTARRPQLQHATAGYTFSWVGLMGSNALGGRINRFAMPMLGIGTERIECELAYDMKVVAADMGIFMEDVVAQPEVTRPTTP